MSAICLDAILAMSSSAAHLYQPFVGERYVNPTQFQEWRSDTLPCSVLLVLANSLSVMTDLGSCFD